MYMKHEMRLCCKQGLHKAFRKTYISKQSNQKGLFDQFVKFTCHFLLVLISRYDQTKFSVTCLYIETIKWIIISHVQRNQLCVHPL